ncbi:hypothetical protein TSAR_010706, partial [Trichomalopsis sarcophagae]
NYRAAHYDLLLTVYVPSKKDGGGIENLGFRTYTVESLIKKRDITKNHINQFYKWIQKELELRLEKDNETWELFDELQTSIKLEKDKESERRHDTSEITRGSFQSESIGL